MTKAMVAFLAGIEEKIRVAAIDDSHLAAQTIL